MIAFKAHLPVFNCFDFRSQDLMLKLGGEWAVWTSLQSSRYCELSYQLGTFGPSTNKKINLDLRPFRHIWAVHIPESVVPGIYTEVHIIPGVASALIFSLIAILL